MSEQTETIQELITNALADTCEELEGLQYGAGAILNLEQRAIMGIYRARIAKLEAAETWLAQAASWEAGNG